MQAVAGRLKVMPTKQDYTFKLSLESDTLLNVMAKRIKEWSYKKNKKVKVPYTMFDAWSRGHVTVDGDMSTNSLKLFLDIFDDHVDEINEVMRGKKKLSDIDKESKKK